ncbi:hypothetical protein Vadar_003174 [Vaccinium darrowii]|uniref:Uncharacterized protein n=1 Tax=Vaccinium darrowii TaxID=229202 RepID=A0ACB7XMX2_9ERIC|nr:hypothetical protein Vadar_003174 [Vaccinium darrowii]
MGILDELRLTAVKLFNRNIASTPPDTDANRCSYDMSVAKAVTRTGDAVRSNGAEKLKESVPDPDHREKMGRILSNIGKFAVDESLKSVTVQGDASKDGENAGRYEHYKATKGTTVG